MNTSNKQQGGFVWLIVLLVVAVVVGIILTNRGNEAVVDEANKTTASEEGTPVSNITPAAPAPTPAKATTPVKTTTPVPAATMTSSGQYIVRYYASGFSPAKITIGLGKSVRFMNSGSDAMQISPVDEVNSPYSSLKQSKSVGNGGTFDFTFTQRGSYGYYNSNNKSHVGIITVQ